MLSVPKLRFLEFSGEWEEKKIGDNGKFFSGGTPLTTNNEFYNGHIPFIKSGEIGQINTKQSITEKGLKSSSAKLVKKGDILFALYGATSGEVAIAKISGAINQAVLRIETNSDNEFLYNYFLKEKARIKQTYLQGGQGNLSAKLVRSLKFSFPSMEEQRKIASFLSKVDEKIEKLEKKQELWETYKKGIMQQIFSQKLRFKDENGENYADWEDGKVKDVLIQKIRKVKKPTKGYWRLGLRSHAKGTFHEFVDDPDKIAMEYLFSVKENDLIVNITFAWEHAIALANKDDENKLVSHRFPTYQFFNNANPLFYRYYVTLARFKHELGNISPGGAGRNRVMRKSDFLQIEIPIPCSVEQTQIANFLSTIDSKIEQINEELEFNKEFKKGLLQQMFC